MPRTVTTTLIPIQGGLSQSGALVICRNVSDPEGLYTRVDGERGVAAVGCHVPGSLVMFLVAGDLLEDAIERAMMFTEHSLGLPRPQRTSSANLDAAAAMTSVYGSDLLPIASALFRWNR